MTAEEFRTWIRANRPDAEDEIFYKTDLRLPAGVRVPRDPVQIERWLQAFDVLVPQDKEKQMDEEKKPDPNVEFLNPENDPSGFESQGVPSATASETMIAGASLGIGSPIASAPYMRGIGRMNPREEPMSPYEQLLNQRDALAAHLKRVEEAIAALEENPAVERVMRLVSRALY